MPKITEYVVWNGKQPIYTGTKRGANLAIDRAFQTALSSGSAEPVCKLVERVVDTDTNEVTETEI